MKPSVFICALLPLFAAISLAQPVDKTLPPYASLNINSTKIDDLNAALASLTPDATPDELSKIFRSNPLFCKTNSNSPWLTDTHAAANALIRDTSPTAVCWQNEADGCTRLKSSGNADITTCSNSGERKGVKCHTAAWAAKHISNNCKNAYSQATGWYDFTEAGVTVWVS